MRCKLEDGAVDYIKYISECVQTTFYQSLDGKTFWSNELFAYATRFLGTTQQGNQTIMS